MIVIGVVMFMYKEGKVNKNTENAGLGELLLIMSLLMDGLTGAIQVSFLKDKKFRISLFLGLFSNEYSCS